jgi:hypothetical protein
MTTFVQDVTLISSKDENIQCPVGYTRLTPNTNQGAGGHWVYLCVLNTPLGINGSEAAATLPFVTDIKVKISSTNSMDPDPGYTKIDTDTNEGAGGDYVNLFKKLEFGVPPLKEVLLRAYHDPDKSSGTTYIGRKKKIKCDLNSGTNSGIYIYPFIEQSNDLEYCTGLMDLGIPVDYCVTAAKHDNTGDFDDYMKKYCSLASKFSSPECTCWNSPVLTKYNSNPLCIDAKCIATGIPSHSMQLGTKCDYTICSVVYNIEQDSSLIIAKNNIYQYCDVNRATGGSPKTSTESVDKPSTFQNFLNWLKSDLLEIGIITGSIVVVCILGFVLYLILKASGLS